MGVSKTLTFGSTANQRPYGILTVDETATSTANNTSTLSIKLVLKRPSSISSTATKTASCTINGTKYTWSGSIGGSGDKTLISKTQTVTHNTDGTKSISISASIDLNISWSGSQIGTISGSATMALTKIPRYATISQSLNNKTETSIVMNWSSNSIIDYIWYSTNNGSSWSGVDVTDGTSGAYTISGLRANTTYQVKTRARRKDSQLTTDSSALSVATYAYPYCNSTPDLTIGNKLTLGFYNPLKRNITVNILGADNSQISDDTTTGTSISGYNNATVQNRFYASIPNSKSGTYKVKVTYSGQISTQTGGTYTVDTSVCKPSIGTVSYKDTNNTTTGITGNNQLIIRNQSQVTVSAESLGANKSATISSCKVVINAVNYNLTINNSSASVSGIVIDSASNVTATFTLTDSRGITTTKNLTITMLDWTLPTAIITLQRQNNFYSETDINVNAEYSSLDGKNTIRIQCRYKKDSESSYGSYVTLQDNVTSTLTLDNLYEWDVQVLLTDKFGSTTYTLYLSEGIPIIFFDRVLHSTGINCFPKEEKSLEVNGYNLERNVMTRSLSSAITDLAVNTYTIIPLDLSNVFGSKLTATNDGGIQIGTNISKILVSGMCSYDTITSNGSRHVRIVKNTYTANNTLAWSWQALVQSQPGQVEVMPILSDVQEGDIVYMMYYTGAATDKIGGNSYGGRTSLTVEVVG